MSSAARVAARSICCHLEAHRRVGGQVALRQSGLAEDADQQVVEIVGDAAREQAKALEPLRVLHAAVERPPLLLGAHALGHLVLERLESVHSRAPVSPCSRARNWRTRTR